MRASSTMIKGAGLYALLEGKIRFCKSSFLDSSAGIKHHDQGGGFIRSGGRENQVLQIRFSGLKCGYPRRSRYVKNTVARERESTPDAL